MNRIISSLFLLCLIFRLPCNAQQEQINLAGSWKFSLDSTKFDSEINLPGSTDEAGIGKKHIAGTKLYTGNSEIWQLARKNVFIGIAWYQKKVEIPKEWKDKRVILSLERCMWQTRLWINGHYVDEEHSLCTPHQYDISEYLKVGSNEIRLCIDNSPYVHLGSWSHGYAPGIQTIWNGAIGDLFLEAKDKISVEGIQCYPSLKEKSLHVKGELVNYAKKAKKGTFDFTVLDPNGQVILNKKEWIVSQKGVIDFSVLLQSEHPLLAWDEYTPYLYTLEVEYKFGSYKGKEQVKFGFRDVSVEDGKLQINGYTLFLRGEHDAGSFPLTGYPSMNKEDWIKIFRTGKDYGMNHWRFHSWCPPEAAFEAADEVGIYLQPELTLFSQDWEHTLVGQDASRDEFLFSELQRLLDTYGNHPSFLLMCMGNELRGDASVLEKWVDYGKKHDNRHLYAGSANLEAMGRYLPLQGDQFQVAHAAKVDGKRFERRMGSYFNTECPNTAKDYSYTLVTPYNQCPIITHELGQWEVYPDFSEIERYTGVLSPRNLEVFKSLLEQKGMGNMASDFLMASGKLAALLYKEDMERVLRTPGMDGFQLLDLRDYQAQGSALIGLLNAFWDSKGLITPEKFRQSCNDVTLLLKMPKRTWKNQETFIGEVVIPNYSKQDLDDIHIYWDVLCDDHVVYTDSLELNRIPQGQIFSCGHINFPLNKFVKASKLDVRLEIPSLGITNEYDVWTYPEQVDDEQGKVIIAKSATPELLKEIENGSIVLLVPDNTPDVERMTFSNPFWSTILFDYQPKTMGLLCDPTHPIFKEFPTDGYTNWQWWELVSSASVARINKTPSSYRPILQVIDHPVRNDKLGAIMETRIGKGKLLICMLDILSAPEKRIVARQLKYSILHYMNSSDFHPEEVPGLKELFFTDSMEGGVYQSIHSSDENVEYPISNMFDGSTKTYCILPAGADTVLIEMELKSERYITGMKLPVKAEGIKSFNLYVTNCKDKKGEPIIQEKGDKLEYQAQTWDNGFTIQKGKKGKYVYIIIDKSSTIDSRLYELNLLFGD